MKYQIFIFLAFLLFLTACSQEDDTIILDNQFSLSYGESASFDLDVLTIEFESVVEDSRCPLDVFCTQAGQVIISLKLDGTISRTLSLNTIEYRGFKITLVDVKPYPISTEQTKDKDYSIDLIVSEL